MNKNEAKVVIIIVALCLILTAVVVTVSINNNCAYEFDCEPVISELALGDGEKRALYSSYNVIVNTKNERVTAHVNCANGELIAIDNFRIKVKLDNKTLYINYKQGDVVGVSTILGDCIRFRKNNIEYGIMVIDEEWRSYDTSSVVGYR